MKTINISEVTVNGDEILIRGKIADAPDSNAIVAQRITILDPVNGSMKHPRQIQMNSNGLLVKRSSVEPLFISKADLIKVAVKVIPKMTSEPVFASQPTKDLPLGNVLSESPVQIIRQQSDDLNNWTEVEGQEMVQGRFYRVIAKNEQGTTISSVYRG
jgi:hypothetical protein